MPHDLLTEMFRLQEELNLKYGFTPGGMMVREDRKDLHDGKWLNNFITAMEAELGELRDCTIWKHWYREAREGRRWMLTDREHAKVEVVDLMFFLMSMAQAVGLTAQDMYDLYVRKLGLNHERRDDDCTQQEAKGYKLKE
jgi:phosphoribosyl-ATP pyrophosphohydrolase